MVLRMSFEDGCAITAIIRLALSDDELTVFGDRSQTLSFCYVDDQVDGIYKLLMVNYSCPVNIGKAKEDTKTNLLMKSLLFLEVIQKCIML